MKAFLKISLLMVIVGLASCEHELEQENFIGPETVAASASFELLDDTIIFSSRTPSLSTEPLTASADFSERVTWVVDLIGLESQAVAQQSGTSDVLDASVFTWDGCSDNNNLFKEGEQVELTLTYVGSELAYVDTITLASTKVYDGVLISDFDGNGLAAGWTKFSDPNTTFAGTTDEGGTPQGDKYYLVAGEDTDSDFNVGGTFSDPISPEVSSDPDEVYLNMYIRGAASTRLDIRAVENDGDEYTYRQSITWEGWQLVSLKYSQLTLSGGPGLGQDPSDMAEVKLLLKSSPVGQQVEAGIDFIILTEGQKFEP